VDDIDVYNNHILKKETNIRITLPQFKLTYSFLFYISRSKDNRRQNKIFKNDMLITSLFFKETYIHLPVAL